MKILNFAYLISLTLAISACSSSPSEADLKAAMIDRLGVTNCKQITVTDFEKVNGIAGKDSRFYQAAIKYKIKVSPLSDATSVLRELEIEHSRQDKALETAIQAQKDAETSFTGSDSERKIIYIRAEAPISDARFSIANRSTLDADLIWAKYSDGCAKKSGFMVGMFSGLSDQKKDWIATGNTQELSDTVTLVKSDNGWMVTN